MRKSTIPTLIALLVILVATVSVVAIIKLPQIYKSEASTDTTARDIRITNITDTSFSVSWLTSKPSIGFVRYFSNGQTFNTPPTNLSKVHFVQLTNLSPSLIYSLSVNSDGKFSEIKQAQTLSSFTPGTRVISGQIFDQRNLPVKGALVLVGINGEVKYSSVTSVSGNWVISLPELPDSTILQILVSSGDLESSALVELKSAGQMPAISLGKSYDFRNSEVKKTDDIPQLRIEVP